MRGGGGGRGLISKQDSVNFYEKTLADVYLPDPLVPRTGLLNRTLADEMSYDKEILREQLKKVATLNTEQKKLYDEILTSTQAQNGKTFFIDAPGGTGKNQTSNHCLRKKHFEAKHIC